MAAASISQVHKATLKNKTKVAVKILRPNIRMEYERDIKMLYWLAKIATFLFDGAKRLRLIEAIDLSKNIMIQELDLSLEAASSNEMWDNSKNDNIVEIPEVYWQYTSSNIMVTKWIDGFSIYDLESIKKANLDTKTISQKIATMFFNQAYRDGFFHADLHPGNILVTKDGKIGLVDFGIVGRLTRKG
ncbi:MAG UNVERIFIED_CONTAM: AarF/UbiB family protein [Rickettsiaceae bacterium]